MALPSQPQRVALTTDANGKNPAFITREWVKILNDALGTNTGGGTPVDVSALTALIALLSARVTSLEARVLALEQGYQI